MILHMSDAKEPERLMPRSTTAPSAQNGHAPDRTPVAAEARSLTLIFFNCGSTAAFVKDIIHLPSSLLMAVPALCFVFGRFESHRYDC